MTPDRAIRRGALLAFLGAIALLVVILPMQFTDVIAGRVVTEGTVQWGVSAESIDTAETPDDYTDLADGSPGIWKVDYEIDGSKHAGAIIGSYSEGQRITIAAPADGSALVLLREAVSTTTRVLSWVLLPLSLGALGYGLVLLSRGLRARKKELRAQAIAQLSARLPHVRFGPIATAAGPAAHGAQGTQAAQAAQAAPESTTRPSSEHWSDPAAASPQGKPDDDPPPPNFYAPYDL